MTSPFKRLIVGKPIASSEEHHQRLRPVLAEINANRASEFDQRVKELKDRLTARAKSLTQQDAVVEARPQRFGPDGAATLTRWEQRQESDARLEKLDTVAGAKASANLFTLIETAKANSLEPHAYLSHLIERLPTTRTVEQFEALLPWNVALARRS